MTHAEKELRNQKIVELRKQGHSQAEIAEIFGLSGVYHICKKYGVDGVMSDRKPDYSKMQQLHLKPSEDYAREVIRQKLNGFAYVGNYTGSSGTADIQCLHCGDVFTQPFTSIRNGRNVICRKCKKIEKEKERETAKAIRLAERLAERYQRQSKKDTELFLSTYQVECSVCGKIFTTRRSRQNCCSEECTRKKGYNRKDKRITKEKRIDKDITVKRLFNRDNGICWICGQQCDFTDYFIRDGVVICGNNYPSVDHVVAICDGGEDSWGNVRLAHRICNTKRYYQNHSAPQTFKYAENE